MRNPLNQAEQEFMANYIKNKSVEPPRWENKLILAIQNAVVDKQKAEIEVLKKKNAELQNNLIAQRRKTDIANMRKEIATVNKIVDSMKPENIRREQFKKMLKNS